MQSGYRDLGLHLRDSWKDIASVKGGGDELRAFCLFVFNDEENIHRSNLGDDFIVSEKPKYL
jgi:hypothetical protein